MPDARPRYRSESADILRERETQKRRDEFRTLTQVCLLDLLNGIVFFY